MEELEQEAVKLVILEDEEAHFELMRRVLEKESPFISITHFKEPASFLARLDQINPDVILVDYMMPGMNGLDLLQELNRFGDRDIPVIMMTGQGSEKVAIEAMRLGAYDYLVKSVYFFKLLPSTIEKVLRKRNLKRSLRESELFNRLLMDSLPHPAMLIRSDRTVLAANRFSRKLGAIIGEHCGRIFNRSGPVGGEGQDGYNADPVGAGATRCAFCLADEALSTGGPKNVPEVRAFGRIWDTWWIPVEEDMLFHYAVDITERKQAENALRESEQQLRSLSTKLLSAQEEERRRIAGELHDSFGSSLAAIKMGLENTRNRLRLNGAGSELLGPPIEWTQLLIDEVRRLMTELRPPVLDDMGVLAALQWFFRQYRTAYPIIHIEVETNIEEQDIPEALRIVIFRISQEAFHNIAKYSNAEYVDFSLIKRDGAIEFTIEDNGDGFDLEAVLSKISERQGLGLASMKERAELSGGSFTIRSVLGTGTLLSVIWPLSMSRSCGIN